jgi:hypothetical protein
MNRETFVAVVKLSACAAVAIALLLVSWFGGDSWFRPVAIVSLFVVALPVTLLVAIDVGRVLRRRRLSQAATIATRLPQLFLGLLACVGSTGGFALLMLKPFSLWWQRIACILVSIGIFLYGVSLLRSDSVSAKDDVSS